MQCAFVLKRVESVSSQVQSGRGEVCPSHAETRVGSKGTWPLLEEGQALVAECSLEGQVGCVGAEGQGRRFPSGEALGLS